MLVDVVRVRLVQIERDVNGSVLLPDRGDARSGLERETLDHVSRAVALVASAGKDSPVSCPQPLRRPVTGTAVNVRVERQLEQLPQAGRLDRRRLPLAHRQHTR